MPMVDLYISQGTMTDEATSAVEWAIPKLREIVAKFLSHPDTGIFPATEVSVDTHYMDTPPHDASAEEKSQHVDAMELDVQIMITSNFYRWRDAQRDELAERILAEFGQYLPDDVTAWCWVKLVNAGFAKRKLPAA